MVNLFPIPAKVVSVPPVENMPSRFHRDLGQSGSQWSSRPARHCQALAGGYAPSSFDYGYPMVPPSGRIVIIMNRKAGLNLLVHAATEAIGQWARDIKGMRMGTLIVIHTFGADMK